LWKGIGIRIRLDAERPLARVDACGLLHPSDLAVVPGLENAAGRPRFGNWGCVWGRNETGQTFVAMNYNRRVPLTERDGTPTNFQGRPGALGREAGGSCRATVVFGEAGANSRIDTVQTEVWGPQPEAERCEWAHALGNAAAARLPSPG
jgi:hypothetical protein